MLGHNWPDLALITHNGYESSDSLPLLLADLVSSFDPTTNPQNDYFVQSRLLHGHPTVLWGVASPQLRQTLQPPGLPRAHAPALAVFSYDGVN